MNARKCPQFSVKQDVSFKGKCLVFRKSLIRDKHSNAYGHVEDASGKIVNIDATPRSPLPPGGKYVASPMPFWMRLTKSGIGMHQGFLPGYAASHGCIRMDKKVVE